MMRRLPPNEDQPEFYTVGQLAELLQLTPMTVYRMVRRGELACHKLGRIKRFRRDDVETFLENSRQPAAEPNKNDRSRPSADRRLASGIDD
jgi:excisionase family DNA binding protein